MSNMTSEDEKIIENQPGDDDMSIYWAVLDQDRKVLYYISWEGGEACPANFYRVTNGQFRMIEYLRWTKKLDVHISEEGSITTSIPPQPPLRDQAQSAFSNIQSQAPMIVAMGESFGPQTQAYVKALQAIINGADTTSTALPTRPGELTD